MNPKTFVYIISLFVCIYATSCIKFDTFVKSNKPVEARLLAIIISIALSYLLTNFITDFISVSAFIK